MIAAQKSIIFSPKHINELLKLLHFPDTIKAKKEAVS